MSVVNVRHSALTIGVDIRSVTAEEFPTLVPDLVALLIETVHGGAALGFFPPVDPAVAFAYWSSLTAEIEAGTRVFIGAFLDGRICGSGQLSLPWLPNARHRAELQKLFVADGARGRGIAHAIMAALHASARQRGRSLIMLNTRPGGIADQFYRRLGYREVGVVPGYAIDVDGRPRDSASLYIQLEL